MKYLLIINVFVFLRCADSPELHQEIIDLKSQLKTTEKTIAELKSSFEPEGDLVHLVLFNLKEGTNQAKVINEIRTLEGIEEVMDLEVGPFQNLGDKRALSDYDLAMQMSFKDINAYKRYQAHPIHLKLKEQVKTLVSGPPATYDFFKK